MELIKPLLAATFDATKAVFPYLATPKIDGIRFVMKGGVALSRSLKPIRNEFIQAMLSANLPDGIDGELTSGDTFQDCGNIMRIKGQPSFKVWIFDYLNPSSPMKGYEARMDELKELEPFSGFSYEVLYPTLVRNQKELDALCQEHDAAGYEGTMVRSPNGRYKFGRSTLKENILLKVKAFSDSEAVIVGFQELERNMNSPIINALGLQERGHSKDGKVAANTLGAFEVEWNGVRFNCGSGLNDSLRDAIWENKDAYLGKLIKFKYQESGIKQETGVPRLPIFLGFRDEDDVS